MKKAVVLFSGGVDSTVMLYKVKQEFEPYTFTINYGQKHAEEVSTASQLVHGLGIPNFIFEDNLEAFRGEVEGDNMSAVHPYRNLFFITVAAMWAKKIGARDIFHGASKADFPNFPDCRETFFKPLNEALYTSLYYPIRIDTPFLELTKAEVVKEGLKLSVPFEKTLSCYRPVRKGEVVFSCGECATCRARLEAFAEAGIKDPIGYIGKENV